MSRHEISDEGWERIRDLLPGKQGDVGQSAKDNKQFINAVLWVSKTGAPWRVYLPGLGTGIVHINDLTVGQRMECGRILFKNLKELKKQKL